MPFSIKCFGNLTITFALAVMTFLITNLTLIKTIGCLSGCQSLKIDACRIGIELIGVFIKPFSLMIRLYANIFAGHIVLMSIIGLMFIFKSWLGSTLSTGLCFALSILRDIGCILTGLYFHIVISALFWCCGRRTSPTEGAH
jgi:F-type H+-transporting ATPase subunit a